MVNLFFVIGDKRVNERYFFYLFFVSAVKFLVNTLVKKSDVITINCLTVSKNTHKRKTMINGRT